jgi:hypothetical protein
MARADETFPCTDDAEVSGLVLRLVLAGREQVAHTQSDGSDTAGLDEEHERWLDRWHPRVA